MCFHIFNIQDCFIIFCKLPYFLRKFLCYKSFFAHLRLRASCSIAQPMTQSCPCLGEYPCPGPVSHQFKSVRVSLPQLWTIRACELPAQNSYQYLLSIPIINIGHEYHWWESWWCTDALVWCGLLSKARYRLLTFRPHQPKLIMIICQQASAW